MQHAHWKLQRARETPSRFVQGFVVLASAARRLFGVDVRAVGIGLHRWPLTQAFRGVVLTRVLIRHGDHSASGIAPIAVRGRTAGALAIGELHRSPSPGSASCERRCFTRVPREANARRPRRVLRCKQGCLAHAEMHGRTISASKPREVGATATGVGRLVAPARRKRSQRAPSRGRLFDQVLPTGDS